VNVTPFLNNLTKERGGGNIRAVTDPLGIRVWLYQRKGKKKRRSFPYFAGGGKEGKYDTPEPRTPLLGEPRR